LDNDEIKIKGRSLVRLIATNFVGVGQLQAALIAISSILIAEW
jgi:hypothetical protein